MMIFAIIKDGNVCFNTIYVNTINGAVEESAKATQLDRKHGYFKPIELKNVIESITQKNRTK